MKSVFMAAIAVAATLFVAPAEAQSPVAFYTGKTVQFIVGYNPGGGYDTYARAAARFIGRHIPGNPNVIVINMPGASSLKSVRYLATQAPKDGTQFGMFNRGLIIKSIMDPKVNVDFGKFTWLGSMNSEINVCYLWKSKGISSLDQLRKARVNIGATSKNSGGYIYSALLRSLSGGAANLVLGYANTADIWLAIEKGELDGNCTLWSSLKAQRAQWLSEGKIDILMQFSKKPHPDLKTVPLVFKLAGSTLERQAFNFLIAADAIGRPVIAPPGLAADRADALKSAFLKTMADPDFLAFAKKANIELDVIDGDQAAQILREIVSTPKAAIDLARKIIE